MTPKTIPELLDEIATRNNYTHPRLASKSASDVPRLLAALRVALRGYGGDTPELAEIARILAGEEL